ncbi:melanoma inhibitory activity protein 2 isoform X2 [Mugil cephalus]|uniref:melanoma inhibitory activity protein 2 isoform X2 n=1 Tax=Mugil cephalus TaxID=48193 RepID=UPI001FB723AB|nr:melanoma inhibitory activity protein 2 isoform X2 [Mugil cephalus]
MDLSHACRFLLIIGAALVIFPHFNLGLLSDYKVCGDSECESLMSRVQAIRDYHGKDCRYLSFRRGDTIFVYHKLTGKREDLWAGTIDKQFGYFPKDAVREEQVYATTEKVVETQKSDFFCMDESGFPIDTTDLDIDDDDDDDDKGDQIIQIQESETKQIVPHTDDMNPESPLTSTETSTESLVSTQEAVGDENVNVGDAATGLHEEAPEPPAPQNEQGGSPPSSWLGSSVTGWLGLAKDEPPGSLTEAEKEDERKETKADSSITSSVTGWLGFGGEGKSDDAEKVVEIREETADSFTSTVTGWFGFKSEKKLDAEKEQYKEEEEEKEEEPVEKFRSRRMSLDLEGSQLQEEEKSEMGTLSWLGNGLSSRLGFGQTNQETGQETNGGEDEEEKEQSASGSWLNMRIGGIMGFGQDNVRADESAGSGSTETEKDTTLQQPTGSQSVETSQSQAEDGKTVSSNEEEPPKEQNVPSTQADSADTNDKNIDTSESSKDTDLHIDAGSKIGHNDIAPHTKSEEKSLGGISNDISIEEDKDQLEDDSKEIKEIDEERSAEMEDKGHQMSTSMGNESQDEIKTENSVPDHSSVSDSIEQPVVVEEDKLQSVKSDSVQGEGPGITNQIDKTEESTNESAENIRDDDHEEEGAREETELAHRNVFTTQTEESNESQVGGDAEDNSGQLLPSAEERNEPIPLETYILTNDADKLAIDINAERETHSELRQKSETEIVEDISQDFGTLDLHSASGNTESPFENVLEEDRGTMSSGENTDQTPVSPQVDQEITNSDSDADKLMETVKETSAFEDVGDPTSTISNEIDSEELNDERKQEMVEVTENEKPEDLRAGEEGKNQEEVEELKEERQDVVGSNDEKKGEILKEEEGAKHEEKQDQMEKLKEEGKQEEAEELMVAEQQQEVGGYNDERLEEMGGANEEKVQQNVKDNEQEEKQNGVEEIEGEGNQQEGNEAKKEDKQEEEDKGMGGGMETEKKKEDKKLNENSVIENSLMDNKEEKEQEKKEVAELKGGEKGEETNTVKHEEKELKEEQKEQKTEESEEDMQTREEEVKEEGRQVELTKEVKQMELTREVKQIELPEEVKQVEVTKEVNQIELPEEVKQVDVTKEVKQTELPEEVKQVDVTKEVKQVEVPEEVKQVALPEEVKPVELPEEVKQVDVTEEVKQTELPEEVKQVEVTKEVKQTELPEEVKQVDVTKEVKQVEVPEELKQVALPEEVTQIELPEEVKQVELPREVKQVELPEEVKQVELPEEVKQVELMEEVKQVELPEEVKQVELTKEVKQVELPEEVKQVELMEEVKQVELPEEVKQVELMEEVKQVELPEEVKQVKLTKEVKQVELPEEVKQAELPEEVKQVEVTEQMLSSHLEEDNISRSESEYNDKVTQDENGLESSFIDITQLEEKQRESEENKQNEVEETKIKKQEGEEVVDHNLKCSNELCPPSEEGPGIERDRGVSEDGMSSASEGKQNEQVAETGERNTIQPDDKMSDNASSGAGNTHILNQGEETRSNGISINELPTSPSEPVVGQVVTPEQTEAESLPPEDRSRERESETGGAFGLFKDAFGFLSQTPTTESKEPTESAQSSDSDPQPHASPTPEQELVSTSDSIQNQNERTDSPQPDPPSAETHLHTASPNTEAPHQSTLTKYYKNLLAHMTVDETTLLLELFGRPKLQFLDYILTTSEGTIEDEDQSILLDVERLLHHHRETLVTPSIRLSDAPQEDKERTRILSALQKLEMLLERVKETFNTRKSDVSNHQDSSCAGASCSTHSKDRTVNTEKDKQREEEGVSLPLGSSLTLEDSMKQILDFVYQTAEDATTFAHAVMEVVSALPDDLRPGPDLYGVPWEPVIVTGLLGLVTMLIFTCRCYSSIKSRLYRRKERWMAEQVAQLLDEKCKVLETFSQCQQEYDELETSLRDSGVLAQTQKTEHLEVKARQLEHSKRELERDLEQLKDQLDQQREHRLEQERRIAMLEESMKTFEEESKELQSQEEQAQTTLKVYNMNSDRLQRNLETAGEENRVLQESNAQLRQQVEGWAERVSEVEAEMRRCEDAHSGMLQDVANKDERIMSLTDRLLSMKAWDSDLEEEEEQGENEANNGTPGKGENGRGSLTDTQGHLQKVQKLIYAAKLNADLKSVDEDKDRVFAKLNDEVKAKEDLEVSIKELENEKQSLQSDSGYYSDEVQRLQQKLHIMTEMYQENELKLHRLLTVEEKERLQKEEKLNKADKNIAMAMEELNNYRQRAEEMEEELEKTKQSYQTQISAHEKKAHNNWLAARAAERELSDIRRENALFRQKLTDTQFKLDALDKDPFALDTLARPLPFRAERSPYGPSPLGRPASETRPFLSPPTLMDGPPARLSPRVSRGPMEPPGGQGEMERSGGPHSDSGSSSPTWDRDRRGPPPGPPGYMFPEPGGPMYRRPPPPPGALGHMPPPGSLPPGPLHPRGLPPGPPHPTDMTDGSYRENSLRPGEHRDEHRESGPGDRRTPPEADPRMGGPLPPGPPMGPMDGPFPRRAPYGPPPPADFYPPRIPGGPPMMPRWGPPPPGMFPPRFPPDGPLLPPAPHPHMPPYGHPMRPPPPDGLPPPSVGPPPPQQFVPSPPHVQSPEEHTPSPEDAI